MPFFYEVHRDAMRPHVERVWGAWIDEDARSEFRRKTDPKTHDVIEWDGTPIGLRWVRRHEDALELVRLFLMPAYQNRGIGSELMHALIAEAEDVHLPIRLRVLRGNPALRFYERLGFETTRTTGTHTEMQRRHR